MEDVGAAAGIGRVCCKLHAVMEPSASLDEAIPSLPPPRRRVLPWLALAAVYTALCLIYFWPLPRLWGDHIGPRPRGSAVRPLRAQVGGAPDPAGASRFLERQHFLPHPGRPRLFRPPPGAGGPARPVPGDRSQRHRRLQLPIPLLVRGQRPRGRVGAAPRRPLLDGVGARRLDVRLLLLPAVADRPTYRS